MNIPQYPDIVEAAKRIDGHAFKTPLISSPLLNEMTGANVWLKPENLQRTGSFKFRGAMNALSLLDEKTRAAGVVASSSGNHAQGIAAAAGIWKVPATIVMPSDAPSIKKENTKRLGAVIVEYDRETEDREAIAISISRESGATFIHPFDNPNVIAGQGTVGLEIAQQLTDLGVTPDIQFVCTGGGGLTSGVALAISHHFKGCEIWGMEPDGFDDYRRSLIAGERLSNSRTSGSICDAILSPSPGEIGFEINQNHLAGAKTVSDDEVAKAVKFAIEELKLVVEPGGAVCLAHLLANPNRYAGKNICAVLSGGNIDPAMLIEILAGS